MANIEIKEYKKFIKIPKEIINAVDFNSFWIIAWFGRCFYRNNRIQREVLLFNTTDINFYFGKERSKNTFKVFIPEEQLAFFKIGDYLDIHGRPLAKKKIKTNKLSQIKDLACTPSHYQTKSIYDLLLYSYYPLIKKERDSNFYVEAPYYLLQQGSAKIIVPDSLIANYFYYHSTRTAYHVIYGDIEGKIVPPIKDPDGFWTVSFMGDKIPYDTVNFLAKYLFIDGSFEILNKIGLQLRERLINESKFNRHNLGIPINTPIPFLNGISMDLLVQNINTSEQLYIAYKILAVRSLENTRPLFTAEQYYLLNSQDTRSLKLDGQQIKENNTTRQITSINEPLTSSSKPGNTNQGTININVTNIESSKFDLSPRSILLDKEIQENRYILDKTFFKEISELTDDYRNRESATGRAIANFVSMMKDLESKTKIFIDAVEELKSEIEISTDYLNLELKQNISEIEPFSDEFLDRLTFLSIVYKRTNFCLIICSDTTKRTALIKHKIEGYCFGKENDTSLKIFMRNIIQENLNWSKFVLLENYNITIKVLHAFNYPESEQQIKNFKSRIRNLLTTQL